MTDLFSRFTQKVSDTAKGILHTTGLQSSDADPSRAVLRAVSRRLLFMEFPGSCQKKTLQLADMLNRLYGSSYLILNMSERQYETGFFLGKVWDVSYRGFPTPPLLLALHLCKELVAFLKRDEKNVGIVHCFRGFARTSLFLAMFIAYFSNRDPSDILERIARTRMEPYFSGDSLLPSQRRYLFYFHTLLQRMRADDDTVSDALKEERFLAAVKLVFEHGQTRPPQPQEYCLELWTRSQWEAVIKVHDCHDEANFAKPLRSTATTGPSSGADGGPSRSSIVYSGPRPPAPPAPPSCVRGVLGIGLGAGPPQQPVLPHQQFSSTGANTSCADSNGLRKSTLLSRPVRLFPAIRADENSITLELTNPHLLAGDVLVRILRKSHPVVPAAGFETGAAPAGAAYEPEYRVALHTMFVPEEGVILPAAEVDIHPKISLLTSSATSSTRTPGAIPASHELERTGAGAAASSSSSSHLAGTAITKTILKHIELNCLSIDDENRPISSCGDNSSWCYAALSSEASSGELVDDIEFDFEVVSPSGGPSPDLLGHCNTSTSSSTAAAGMGMGVRGVPSHADFEIEDPPYLEFSPENVPSLGGRSHVISQQASTSSTPLAEMQVFNLNKENHTSSTKGDEEGSRSAPARNTVDLDAAVGTSTGSAPAPTTGAPHVSGRAIFIPASVSEPPRLLFSPSGPPHTQS